MLVSEREVNIITSVCNDIPYITIHNFFIQYVLYVIYKNVLVYTDISIFNIAYTWLPFFSPSSEFHTEYVYVCMCVKELYFST